MELLKFEDIKCSKPTDMHGDLHVTPEGFYFLAFKEINPWSLALASNFGLLGIWLMSRTEKKRKTEIQQWRLNHNHRPLDELVSELPGSWIVLIKEVQNLKPGFLCSGLTIKHQNGQKFSVDTKKEQWRQIQDFAQKNNWHIITHIA